MPISASVYPCINVSVYLFISAFVCPSISMSVYQCGRVTVP